MEDFKNNKFKLVIDNVDSKYKPKTFKQSADICLTTNIENNNKYKTDLLISDYVFQLEGSTKQLCWCLSIVRAHFNQLRGEKKQASIRFIESRKITTTEWWIRNREYIHLLPAYQLCIENKIDVKDIRTLINESFRFYQKLIAYKNNNHIKSILENEAYSFQRRLEQCLYVLKLSKKT